MTIAVYGASDDLIEVEGDITEEFDYRAEGNEGELLVFSDGTILRIALGSVWRISPVVRGTASLIIDGCTEGDDDNYSDRATLDGPIAWVVRGDKYAWAR